MKKPLIVAGVVSTIALGSIAGVSAATSGTKADGQDNLVNKIASKFNLNKDQVKAVFDEDRTAREAEQQKSVETELNKLVTDGKITSAQKDAILAKGAELKAQMEANRDSFKDMTDAERKAAMDQNKSDLEAWAKTNGIPTDYLKYFMGHGPGGHGHGMPGGQRIDRDGNEAQPPTTTN